MRLIYIIFVSFILSSCTSVVNYDYDKSINFNSISTFKINAIPARVTNDTRINSPFMQQRVVAELNAALKNKGFKNSTDNAELEVNYFLDIKQELETDDSGFVSIGFGSASPHSAIGLGFNIPLGEVSSTDKLVLTIDFVATDSKKLIWRGTLGYPLYEGASPDTYNSIVNRLVAEILEKFPPK